MMNYLVYENGDLIAGFMSLCTATTFIEGWYENADIRMDLVSGDTGEILGSFSNGTWESGNF